jgi:hypothetical protein
VSRRTVRGWRANRSLLDRKAARDTRREARRRQRWRSCQGFAGLGDRLDAILQCCLQRRYVWLCRHGRIAILGMFHVQIWNKYGTIGLKSNVPVDKRG